MDENPESEREAETYSTSASADTLGDSNVPSKIVPQNPAPLRDISDILICCFYLAVFCFVGVPVWWKTTAVSRVSLPFDEIEAYATYQPQQVRSLPESPASKAPGVGGSAQKWTNFWSLPPTTAIDLVITVVNPAPSVIVVSWEPENGLKRFLDPSLSMLSAVANFTVSSQVLRYMDEDIKVTFDTVEQSHLVTLREASKIINHVESRLGTFSSNNHVLNFIVYVPPPQQRPLKLVGTDRKVIPTNSFITPRWGGVFIHSPDTPPNDAVPSTVEVDVKSVAEVVLTQLYAHLGLFEADQLEGAQDDLEKNLPHLMVKRAKLNIDDSISTLKSLARLLEQMGSIAINEVVAGHIYDAVQLINDAKDNLDKGLYVEALSSSRRAWENSERAFYDPSLLEQLYFPDDQKFAIYVPLFLPAALPVVLSLNQIIKWWKDRRSEKTLAIQQAT